MLHGSGTTLFSTERLSSTEQEVISRRLSNLGKEQSRVNAAQLDTVELLVSLRDEKNTLEKKIEQHLALLSPIRWIPFEIMGHIFTYYMDNHSADINSLMLVCRAWRAVAAGHPSLWTRLEVTGTLVGGSIAAYKRYIEICAQRSGNLPLSVKFDIRSINLRTFETAASLLAYIAMFAGPRWSSFTFIGVAYPIGHRAYTHIFQHIFSQARKLQSISIHGPWTKSYLEDDFSSNESCTVMFTCPQDSLKSLELIGVPCRSVMLKNGDIQLFRRVKELVIGWDQGAAHWRSLAGEREHWLTAFPSLQKLTLCADDTLSESIVTTPTSHYETATITQLVLRGPIPLWTISSVSFTALKDVSVKANDHSAHSFHGEEIWDSMEMDTVENLTLSCARCSKFWSLSGHWSRSNDQALVRRTFAAFRNLKRVKAPSCVWRQIRETFDVYSGDIDEAAEGPCADYYIIAADKLYSVLDSLETDM